MSHTLAIILLSFLVVCALAASFARNLLNTVLIFMSYSLIMSVIWVILESPDLAITEAAVGAGVTTVLFLVTLKKIRSLLSEEAENPEDEAYINAFTPGEAEEDEDIFSNIVWESDDDENDTADDNDDAAEPTTVDAGTVEPGKEAAT